MLPLTFSRHAPPKSVDRHSSEISTSCAAVLTLLITRR